MNELIRAATRGLLSFGANIRSVKKTDNGMEIEGIANDVTTTDSYKTRFQFTDDCINASIGGSFLFNHGASEIAGVNLDMQREKDGSLFVRDVVDFTPAMPNGLTYADAVTRGYLNGLSIRFDEDAKFVRGKEFDLIIPNVLDEHSLVTLPSNRASRLSSYTRGILDSLEQNPEGAEISNAFRLMVNGLRDVTPAEPEPTTEPVTERRERDALEPALLERFDRRESTTRAAGPLDFGTLFARLNEEITELYKSTDDYWYTAYLQAVTDAFMIVSTEYGAYLYQHAYSVDANGIVTVDPNATPVIATWQAVGVDPEASESEGIPARALTLPELNARLLEVKPTVRNVPNSIADLGRKLALAKAGA